MLGLVIAAVVLQTVSAQGPPFQFPPGFPEKCKGPPQDAAKPHECCEIPSFFPEAEFKECGFTKPDAENGPPRPGPPDCSKQQCMLQKHKLINDDNTMNFEKMGEFMDDYSSTNPQFKEAVEKAKTSCLKENLPGPPHICEANKIVFCISKTIFENCPEWKETDGCKNLKDHMDLCASFFQPPEPPKK